MRKSPGSFVVGALAAALVSLSVHAAQPQRTSSAAAVPADLLPDAAQRRLSLRASDFAAGASVNVEDVGDVDSFGRNVKWLGVAQMNITLAGSCPKPIPGSNSVCAELSPAPAVTTFQFEDVAYIRLPGKSAHSLLCHWFSPFMQVGYGNPTASPAVARLHYTPTLTIESPVLDDPSLIDPTTGLPFGGRLLTGMSATERNEVPLSPGQSLNTIQRDTATCIAGFLTRRQLTDTFGLSPRQANAVFANEITIRMNISGNAQYLNHFMGNFGLRVVGD